ncbi:MAG: hypothetical protein NC320_04630 [Clostridium sp.]|nr:hypothetical protein [Clostridium sp.]
MKSKLLINRLLLSSVCSFGYMIIFISMVNLKICGYNKPLNSMPCYLCFWGIYLVYFVLCGMGKTNSIELIRYGSLWKYICRRIISTFYSNLIYCVVFSLFIYAYEYFSVKIINPETVVIFFSVLLLTISLMTYIILIIQTFCGKKTALGSALVIILLCSVPELSFFISVRLNMANNYYIKPMMLITKAPNNVSILKDIIPVIAVWSIAATVLGIAIKKMRKTVCCDD